jgi:hypothetical protein
MTGVFRRQLVVHTIETIRLHHGGFIQPSMCISCEEMVGCRVVLDPSLHGSSSTFEKLKETFGFTEHGFQVSVSDRCG